MEITVKDNPVVDSISVNLVGVSCCLDVISIPSLLFWLDSNEADKLIKELQVILQDRARRYEEKEIVK
jgi:hypothetical protein